MSFARSRGRCWAGGPGTLCSGLSDWRLESPSTVRETQRLRYRDIRLQGSHFTAPVSYYIQLKGMCFVFPAVRRAKCSQITLKRHKHFNFGQKINQAPFRHALQYLKRAGKLTAVGLLSLGVTYKVRCSNINTQV